MLVHLYRFFLLTIFLLQAISGFSSKNPGPGRQSHFLFIENKGQWNANVLYKVQLPSGALFLEKSGLTFNLINPELTAHRHEPAQTEKKNHKAKKKSFGHAYKVQFENTGQQLKVEGENPMPEKYNFFYGTDQNKWVHDAKGFTRVIYKNLYEGIDLVIYSKNGNLKYDLIINPGADPAQVSFLYKGLESLALKNGSLILKTSISDIKENAPVAFSRGRESNLPVKCNYMLKGNRLSYQLPDGYNKTAQLVIDPELVFSTYSGSFADNFGYTATYDSKGYLYSGSTVFDVGYPVSLGAYDETFNGLDVDIAISKYDTTGTFMVYSTLIGGAGNEMPHSMIVNKNDELYVYGTTGSTDFPVTANAFDKTFSNAPDQNPENARVLIGLGLYFPHGTDIVVFKFNSTGTDLLASTYVGGGGTDGLNSITHTQIKVNADNLPLWFFYNDAFDITATHIENTYLSIERPIFDTLKYNYADEARGEIDIDDNNNVYLATCTNSKDFPILGGGAQSTYGGGRLDGVVVQMDDNLSNVIWSSYLGGSGADAIYSLALDSASNIYVAGGTVSTDFPIAGSPLQTGFNGGRADGFVSCFSQNGSQLLASGYYGTEQYDQIYFIERDYRNYIYVMGQTESQDSADYVFNVKYAHPGSGQFISKFEADLSKLDWSTSIGTGSGAPDISPSAFLVDVCRKIYLSGWGGMSNYGRFHQLYLHNNAGFMDGMEVTADAFQKSTDGSDFYLMVLEDDASALYYATFMGGSESYEHVDGGTSRFDRKGKVYQSVCGGCGAHSDFPIKPANAVSPTNNSDNCNNAVFKVDLKLPMIVADFQLPDVGCAPYEAIFTNTSLEYQETKYYWDFGDGSPISNEKNATHTYTHAGKFRIKLKLVDNKSCNLMDSISKELVILADTSYSLPTVNFCPGQSAKIGLPPSAADSIRYTWVPSVFLSDSTVANPFSKPDSNVTYTLYVTNGVCTDTVTQQVKVNPVEIGGGIDTLICIGSDPVTLFARTDGSADNFHWSDYSDFRNRINDDPTDSSISVTPPLPFKYYYLKAGNEFGCTDIDTFKISYSLFSIDLGPSRQICNGDTTAIIAETLKGFISEYLWEPSDKIIGRTDTAVITVSPPQAQYYVLRAMNNDNCEAVDSVWINVLKDTSYTLPTLNLCPGKSAELGPDAVDSLVYRWSSKLYLSDSTIANPVVTPLDDMSYLLFVSNGVCTDTLTQSVTLKPVLISDRIKDTIICSTAPPVVLTAKATGENISYHWSSYSDFRNRINSGPSDPVAVVDPPASVSYYYLKVTNSWGCEDIDTVKIYISDFNFRTDPDQLICSGGAKSIGVRSLIGEPGLRYNWQPAKYIEGRNDTSVVVVKPVKPTMYYVTVLNRYNCIYRDSVFVDLSEVNKLVLTAWTDKDTIRESQSTRLHVRPATGYHYSWNPYNTLDNSGIPDPLATPKVTTRYKVSVSDTRIDCRADTTVIVYVMPVICDEPDVFIPNAFTPNNDGNNDILFVRGSALETVHLIIYDRWGEKVFESFDVKDGWNGKYNNKDLDPAVFVYYLEATCIGGKHYFKKGNVTLLR
jgi:gliding motility-associated-like protein